MKELLRVFAARAKHDIGIVMPGYTHMQRAQPALFSHWLLSHATYIMGDLQRLEGAQERLEACPLGIGALAENPFGIDRAFLARDLGFSESLLFIPTVSRAAAVGGRDFVVEIL